MNHQLDKQELVSQLDGRARDLASIAHNNSEEPPALISNSRGKDLTKDPDLKDHIRTVIANAAMNSNDGSNALIQQMSDYNRSQK